MIVAKTSAEIAQLFGDARRTGWAMRPSVITERRAELISVEASTLPYTPLESVGRVRQQGRSATAPPPPSCPATWALAHDLKDAAQRAGVQFEPNEAMFQSYVRGGGVSSHRDHRRYVDLIIVVALAGSGDFQVTADRAGTDVLADWSIAPGALVVLDANRRPGILHSVIATSDNRLSVTYRARTPSS